MNKIEITGNIARINDTDDKYIWFDICRNEKYTDKNGTMQETASFFDVKINKSNSNIELIKKGAFINIIGVPNSYIDKNKIKKFYIYAFEIKELTSKDDSSIKYDKDGVMIWHGKRCESKEASPEKIKELEDMFSEL